MNYLCQKCKNIGGHRLRFKDNLFVLGLLQLNNSCNHDDLFSRRCSLFLWDKERDELVAKVFDGEIPSNGGKGKVCDICAKTSYIKMTIAVIGVEPAVKYSFV